MTHMDFDNLDHLDAHVSAPMEQQPKKLEVSINMKGSDKSCLYQIVITVLSAMVAVCVATVVILSKVGALH